jgi:hypothetical protein
MSSYLRALHDPAFLDRFARAYRGRHEPLDALWWHDHPGEAAPTGTPAPEEALAGLRRAVYAPGADPGVRERYGDLQAEVERDRAAVREAVAVAEADRPHPVAEAEPAPSGGPAAGVPIAAASPTPRRLLLAAGVAAVGAFVAGLLVAPLLGGGGAARPTPAASPPETAPFISGASGTGSALGIFGEPQREVDRPAIPISARLLPTTFRRLQAVPLRGVDVYAAQDSAGDVCVVALSTDARVHVACAPIVDWRAEPIRLTFRADAYTDEGTRWQNQVELVATWAFLGPFSLEESAVGK